MNKISLGLNNFITFLSYGFFISTLAIFVYSLFSVIDIKIGEVENVDMAAFIAASIVIILVSGIIGFVKRKYIAEDRHTPLNKVLNFATLIFSSLNIMAVISVMFYKWIVVESNQVSFWQSLVIFVASLIALVISLSNTLYINKGNFWNFVSKYDVCFFNILAAFMILVTFFVTDPRGSALKAKDEDVIKNIYGLQESVGNYLGIKKKAPEDISDLKDYYYGNLNLKDFDFKLLESNISTVSQKQCNAYSSSYDCLSVKYQGDIRYSICSDFNRSNTYDGKSSYWNHTEGKNCFNMRAYFNVDGYYVEQDLINLDSKVKSPLINEKYEMDNVMYSY